MNIIKAIKDPNLFRPFLADADDSLSSWGNWMAALRVLYGLPIRKRRAVVQECTARTCTGLPAKGFDAALLLTGRRSGKSRIAAIIGAYEAALGGHESKLSKGENGIVPIVAPTKAQARIVKNYLRAIFDVPLLRNQVASETKQGFELTSGTRIEILAGDFRTIRGYTLLAAIVDEIAFFGLDDESKIKSDTELVRAIKPSLATVGGKLIAITSPYAKKGYCFKTHAKNFGNENGKTLVWNCPSRTMNPTLPQSVVDEAMEDDMASALSEYGGQFRDDVANFLPREVIEKLVVKDRGELMPHTQLRYSAFVDLSGGRNDDAAIAIAHREDRTVVIDLARRFRPPFNPVTIIVAMCDILKKYRIRRVTGDNYAAEFCASAFEQQGIGYSKSERPKAALYLELLPRLCSGEIELPDDPILVNQLASLERRTRSGGRDIIDHPQNGHDDLANVVAGVSVCAASSNLVVGAMFR